MIRFQITHLPPPPTFHLLLLTLPPHTLTLPLPKLHLSRILTADRQPPSRPRCAYQTHVCGEEVCQIFLLLMAVFINPLEHIF